jgi:hypothetical protein
MRRYEQAVIRRAITRGQQLIGRRRLSVTADRGFADVALGEVLAARGVEFLSRGTGRTKGCGQGQWRRLATLGFVGTTRPRNLGQLAYCESAPPRLWGTRSRARDRQGHWDPGSWIPTRARRARATAAEYARRCGCAQGGRDTKWALGFAPARSKDSKAWSRRFALFALALRVVVSVAVKLLVSGGPAAVALLRRVASRRRERWDLSVVSARVRLLHEDKGLFAHLSSHIKFHLEARLVYVS